RGRDRVLDGLGPAERRHADERVLLERRSGPQGRAPLGRRFLFGGGRCRARSPPLCAGRAGRTRRSGRSLSRALPCGALPGPGGSATAGRAPFGSARPVASVEDGRFGGALRFSVVATLPAFAFSAGRASSLRTFPARVVPRLDSFS